MAEATITERCPRCGRFMGNRKVGLGRAGAWMCLACFDHAIKAAGRRVRALLGSDDG